MALIPCTCIYGPRASSADRSATGLIALARDPWCPAIAVHDRLAEQPAGTGVGDLETLD